MSISEIRKNSDVVSVLMYPTSTGHHCIRLHFLLLPITAGWTAAFVKVSWFFRGLPKPNEILEIRHNAGI